MLLTLAVFATACGGGSAANDGSQGAGAVEETPVETPAEGAEANALEAIKASGQLRLGTSADYPPFEFHQIVDGKDTIVGIDIEIAKAIAADLGVELAITDMPFDGLLTALQSGNLDMVASAVTPDEDRAKSVDFSDIYYTSLQKVIVRAEDKAAYTSIESLAGKKVGAQLGSVQQGIVEDQLPQSELRALAKLPDLVLDLKSGNIEAIVVEEPVANEYIAANPELTLSDIALAQDEEGFALALPKGSAELVAAVNATLKRLADEGKIDQFVTDATNAMENKAE